MPLGADFQMSSVGEALWQVVQRDWTMDWTSAKATGSLETGATRRAVSRNNPVSPKKTAPDAAGSHRA